MADQPSLFDVLGPIMIGPSSSHTAGASRIGLIARQLLTDAPTSAEITLYNSFAKTHKGHGTDRAIVGGVLGFHPDDVRIKDSFRLAKEAGLKWSFSFQSDTRNFHSNSARIHLTGKSQGHVEIVGASLGGGRIRIREVEGFAVDFGAQEYTLVVVADDIPGSIKNISGIIATDGTNIANMNVSRTGNRASMVLELDQALSERSLQQVRALHWVQLARLISPLEGGSSLYEK